jgi:hypothetical protein
VAAVAVDEHVAHHRRTEVREAEAVGRVDRVDARDAGGGVADRERVRQRRATSSWVIRKPEMTKNTSTPT